MLWRLYNPYLPFGETVVSFVLDCIQNKTGPWITWEQMVSMLGWGISVSPCACFTWNLLSGGKHSGERFPAELDNSISKVILYLRWWCTFNQGRTCTHSAGVLWKEAQSGIYSQETCRRVCSSSCCGFTDTVTLALSLSSPSSHFCSRIRWGSKKSQGRLLDLPDGRNLPWLRGLRFVSKKLWLSGPWFSHGLYWNQRILSDSNELMNLKVHICKGCFIHNVTLETKPRPLCYGACDPV